MANNIVSNVSPELIAEIEKGLRELDKDGYSVQATPDANGKPTLHFKFGESQQTLHASGDWQKPGIVSRMIVDKLNI